MDGELYKGSADKKIVHIFNAKFNCNNGKVAEQADLGVLLGIVSLIMRLQSKKHTEAECSGDEAKIKEAKLKLTFYTKLSKNLTKRYSEIGEDDEDEMPS